jgi:hypothetical protein
MVAVAGPVPTAVQVRAAASSGTLGPEHLGGQLLGLGEGLGLIGSRRLVRLVAVDGGLVVGSLALRGLLAAQRRPDQAAQRVAVAGWVGLVQCLSPETDGERHGCKNRADGRRCSAGYRRCKPHVRKRTEPAGCGAEQRSDTAGCRSDARQVDLLRQDDSFSKHRQATYFMLPVIGAR